MKKSFAAVLMAIQSAALNAQPDPVYTNNFQCVSSQEEGDITLKFRPRDEGCALGESATRATASVVNRCFTILVETGGSGPLDRLEVPARCAERLEARGRYLLCAGDVDGPALFAVIIGPLGELRGTLLLGVDEDQPEGMALGMTGRCDRSAS